MAVLSKTYDKKFKEVQLKKRLKFPRKTKTVEQNINELLNEEQKLSGFTETYLTITKLVTRKNFLTKDVMTCRIYNSVDITVDDWTAEERLVVAWGVRLSGRIHKLEVEEIVESVNWVMIGPVMSFQVKAARRTAARVIMVLERVFPSLVPGFEKLENDLELFTDVYLRVFRGLWEVHPITNELLVVDIDAINLKALSWNYRQRSIVAEAVARGRFEHEEVRFILGDYQSEDIADGRMEFEQEVMRTVRQTTPGICPPLPETWTSKCSVHRFWEEEKSKKDLEFFAQVNAAQKRAIAAGDPVDADWGENGERGGVGRDADLGACGGVVESGACGGADGGETLEESDVESVGYRQNYPVCYPPTSEDDLDDFDVELFGDNVEDVAWELDRNENLQVCNWNRQIIEDMGFATRRMPRKNPRRRDGYEGRWRKRFWSVPKEPYVGEETFVAEITRLPVFLPESSAEPYIVEEETSDPTTFSWVD